MKTIQSLRTSGSPSGYKLHRILGIERFLQMLHEDSLTLIAPEKWDDPYEKALQKHYEDGGILLNGTKVFGLCWSSEARSDALWRIYSPNKLGIKITTTVARLVNALAIGGGPDSLWSRTVLGRVAYFPERWSDPGGYKFTDHPLSLCTDDFERGIGTFSGVIDEITRYRPVKKKEDTRRIARAFLVKRRAFSHEAEIRLLCFPDPEERSLLQPGKSSDSKVIKLQVPMQQLITRVEFDPRMGNDVADAISAFISPKLPHLGKLFIKKSSLYNIPASKGLPR